MISSPRIVYNQPHPMTLGMRGSVRATASELGYTGGLKLSGDLLHLRARVYHPRLKRFLSADVIELARYTYTAGDPVNLVDPSGLEAMSDQQANWTCNNVSGWCTGPDGTMIPLLDEVEIKTGYPTIPGRGYSDPYEGYDDMADDWGGSRGDGPRGGGESGGDVGDPGSSGPPVMQAGVLDAVPAIAEGLAYWLAGGSDAIGSVALGVVLQTGAGIATSALMVWLAPGLVAGAIVGAAAGGTINVAINWAISKDYSFSQGALDFGLGAVGGVLPGLMAGNAVSAAVRATGTRALTSQTARAVEAGGAIWGASWGLASGAVKANVSP